MTGELFTTEGLRRYLDDAEHVRFLAAAAALERGEVRTLCTTLAYTGCRISEALELTADRVDLSSQVVTFRSLKKRGKTLYRSVPVPEGHLDTLDLVHGLRKAQRAQGLRHPPELGPHAGHQAKHVWAIMDAAVRQSPARKPASRGCATGSGCGWR